MSRTESHGPLFDEFSAVNVAEWKEKVREDLGISSPDDFLEWSSLEGTTMSAYLQRDALDQIPHLDQDAAPPPLADAAGRPANAWTLCQPIDHPDPDTANEQARSAVEGGADALRLSLSPPPSQEPGLELTSVEDLTTLLDGIDLAATELHVGRGLAAPVLYGALREHLSAQNIDPADVRGTVLYDPVAALASGGPDAERTFSLADHLVSNAQTLPNVGTVTVDVQVYHEAGASAVQELAFTLGALVERLARSMERGRSLSALLDELQVLVSVSTSYFVEMAKLRALRLLVPQVVRPFRSAARADLSFSPSDLILHAETSRRTETIYDPHVNMLRATTEAMSAVLGGCDTLTVRPYDASLRLPDAFGTRIARNTQLILKHEAHLDEVTDPAAGSYYVEALTDELAQKAWKTFQDLEAEGGIVEALRDGTVQRRIANTRRERLEALDEREHVLVGTTHYPALDERRRDDLASSDAAPSTNGESALTLEAVSIDAIREAFRSGASLPKVTSALQTSLPDLDPLPRIRVAAEIESIRLRTERYAETHDGPPRVLLVPIGPTAARSVRATFARNVLGVAGFEIDEPLKFDSIPEAADAATENDVDIVVLCSSDAESADLAPALASALEDRDHDALLLIAGAPDRIDASGAGDFFLHQGRPLKDTLETLQSRLGMSVKTDA